MTDLTFAQVSGLWARTCSSRYATRVTPAPASARKRHRLGTCAIALALPLGVSACQLTSPMQTTHVYSPADGVQLEAGSLEIVDLLVVSEGNGAPGVVAGYAVNTGTEPVTVDLAMSVEGTPTPLSPSIEVPPGSSMRLDGDPAGSSEAGGEPVLIPEVSTSAGQTVSMRLSTSAGQVASTLVPVLLPQAPYDIYGDMLDATG